MEEQRGKLYLISCFWGNESVRYQQLLSTLNQLLKLQQKQSFQLIFAFASSLPLPKEFQLLNARVIKFEWSELSRFLWHKEHLYNVMIARSKDILHDYDRCYFFDCDLIFNDDWFICENIKSSFLENGGVVQGFEWVKTENHSSLSWCAQRCKGELAYQNTGLIWGMTLKTYNQLGGWPSLPDGSGDSAWVMEITGKRFGELCRKKWFLNSLRVLSYPEIDYLPVTVDRMGNAVAEYVNRTRFWEYLALPFSTYFSSAEDDLLKWNDIGLKCFHAFYPSQLEDHLNIWRQQFNQLLADGYFSIPLVLPRFYGDSFGADFFDFTGTGFVQIKKIISGFQLLIPSISHGVYPNRIEYHRPSVVSSASKCKLHISSSIPISLHVFVMNESGDDSELSKFEIDRSIEFMWLPPRFKSKTVSLRLDFESPSFADASIIFSFEESMC